MEMRKEDKLELCNLAGFVANRFIDYCPIYPHVGSLEEDLQMLQDCQLKIAKMKNLLEIEKARRKLEA